LYMRYSRNGDIKSQTLATKASENWSDIFKADRRINDVSLVKSPALG
jgi:hypothetical protein